ncbi:hypothetical protein DSO57_1028817 [Entomophthora muscae]|uniref:Uncharacterized protein n=1 Tax=Entomophthora muscae TaxID=34485 RepID=A0ACC2RSC3_9FUNG|nr:hypothetical protein DSO57_1028817 [Entomophthora muscae]
MPATLFIALGVGATGSAAAVGSCIYRALRRPREPKAFSQVSEETSLITPGSETLENNQVPLSRGLPDSTLKVASRKIQHSVTPSIETIKPPVISPNIVASPQQETSVVPPDTPEEATASPVKAPMDSQKEVKEASEKEISESHSLKSNSSATVTPGLSPESTRKQSPPGTPAQAKPEPITPTSHSRPDSRMFFFL